MDGRLKLTINENPVTADDASGEHTVTKTILAASTFGGRSLSENNQHFLKVMFSTKDANVVDDMSKYNSRNKGKIELAYDGRELQGTFKFETEPIIERVGQSHWITIEGVYNPY